MGQLLPILKPAGYRQDVPLFFKERLFYSSYSPVIAFGTDEGNSILYEAASNEEEYNRLLPSLKQQALKNLKAIQPEIQIQDLQGTKVAYVIGTEYASEKILDVDFMKQVGKSIGSVSLMVGIPFRGCLMATDSESEIRLKFPVVIAQHYNNSQQAPISDKVFLVNNGEIIAMAGEKIENDESSDGFIITEKGKTNNYEVELNSKSIEQLTDHINSSYQQIMLMITQRNVFGGEITYHIGKELELNNQLIEKCQNYCKQIETNEMAQSLIKILTNSPINISFYYQNKKIAPAESNTADTLQNLNFSDMTEQELNNEFYRIVSIPNARKNITALTEMSALMQEYKKRGLELPTKKPLLSESPKKWWQFWK